MFYNIDEKRDRAERDLELAEQMLRELLRYTPNRGDYGWVINRRAAIYAAEAEIRRLRALVGVDQEPD